MIRHRPFNARLPGTFHEGEVQEAFARLLVGDTHPGSGDFTYRGQPMSLCDPLDPALLPPRPVIPLGLEPANCVYAALGNVGYESGFEPVNEALFDRVKALEASWKDDCARAARHAYNRAAELWAQADTLRLEALNDTSAEVPDYGEQDFAELRPLYPELSMLSDGSLFAWFDCYQMECCYINGWTASRDDDFLFYLLGKVAGRQYERETSKEVGEWVAYALLRGDSLDAALAFGRAAALYNDTIARIAYRIATAMRFLAEDKKATNLHGHPIRTFADMFREGRKCNSNVQPMVATQDLSALLSLTAVAKREAPADGFVYLDGKADADVGGLALNVMEVGSAAECLNLIAKMTDVELTPERQEAGERVINSLPVGATLRDFLEAGKADNAQRLGLTAEMVEALAPMLSALECWLEPGKYGQLFNTQQ